MSLERRFLPLADRPIRVERREDGGAATVHGYASVFYRAGDAGTEYRLMEDVYERIAPTAFDRALQDGDDTRALYNHNADWLLGRRSAKTLRLSADEVGLRYEVDIPDTQIGRDVVTSIERGDLSGSSFAFFVRKASWSAEGDRDIRQIDDVELVDVGPVTYPAYDGTSTGLRAWGSVVGPIEELAAWREQRTAEREAEESRRKLFAFRARARLRT